MSINVISNNFYDNYFKEIIEDYSRLEKLKIQHSDKLYFLNKNDKSKSFDFKNFIIQKRQLKRHFMQNEISSIAKVAEDKIMIFETSTIDPSLNTSLKYENFNFKNELSQGRYEKRLIRNFLSELDEQHLEFNKFFRHITYTNRNNKLKYKNIRIYELTKKKNLHCHKINLLEKLEDLTHYIQSIFLSRNKNNIGRIEIAIDNDILEKYIVPLFETKSIKVRINNKYIYLSLESRIYDGNIQYVINESIKNNVAGNKIYFRGIVDKENDKTHLTKYLFKYMLKTQDNKDKKTYEIIYNKETALFKKLERQQKVISDFFFTDKIETEYLKYLNNIFIINMNRYTRQKENYKGLLNYLPKSVISELFENKNHLMYYLSKMINEGRLLIDKSEDNIMDRELLKIRRIIEHSIEFYTPNNHDNYLTMVSEIYGIEVELFNSEISLNDEYLNRYNRMIKQIANHYDEMKNLNEIMKDCGIGKEDFTMENYLNDYMIIESKKNKMDNKLVDTLTNEFFKRINEDLSIVNNKKIYYVENTELTLLKTHNLNEFLLISFNNNLEKSAFVLDYNKDSIHTPFINKLIKQFMINYRIFENPKLQSEYKGKSLAEIDFETDLSIHWERRQQQIQKDIINIENLVYTTEILNIENISIKKRNKYLKNEWKLTNKKSNKIEEINISEERLNNIRKKIFSNV